MDALLQQVFAGLANGSIYASLALALVIIYRATNTINFAQGEMAMFSTYIAWLLLSVGLSYWLAFAAAVLLSFLLGVLIEKLVVGPVGNAPALTVVTVYIGLLMIINSAAGWLFSYNMRPFPSPFPAEPIAGIPLSPHQLGMTAVVIVELAIVFLFFRFTSLGLAMRAAAENPASSALVGVDVGLMLALGWGLAGLVGAVAGIMSAPIVYLDPNMMSGVLIYGFAGALLGGIRDPLGAIAGGFIIGVLENLAGAYVVGTELKLSVALVVIVAVLLVKPAGLFGRALAHRV